MPARKRPAAAKAAIVKRPRRDAREVGALPAWGTVPVKVECPQTDGEEPSVEEPSSEDEKVQPSGERAQGGTKSDKGETAQPSGDGKGEGDSKGESGGVLMPDPRPNSRAQRYVFQKCFADLPNDVQKQYKVIQLSKLPDKQAKLNRICNACVSRDRRANKPNVRKQSFETRAQC